MDRQRVRWPSQEEILFTKVPTFEAFISLGKDGQSAYILYNFLQYLSKIKQGNSFYISFNLVKEELDWGRNKYLKSRRILIDLGLLTVVIERTAEGAFKSKTTEINTTPKTQFVPPVVEAQKSYFNQAARNNKIPSYLRYEIQNSDLSNLEQDIEALGVDKWQAFVNLFFEDKIKAVSYFVHNKAKKYSYNVFRSQLSYFETYYNQQQAKIEEERLKREENQKYISEQYSEDYPKLKLKIVPAEDDINNDINNRPNLYCPKTGWIYKHGHINGVYKYRKTTNRLSGYSEDYDKWASDLKSVLNKKTKFIKAYNKKNHKNLNVFNYIKQNKLFEIPLFNNLDLAKYEYFFELKNNREATSDEK